MAWAGRRPISALADMLLGFDELAAWSGLKRPAAVRRWLADRGIAYTTRPDGRPVTSIAAIDSAILGGRRTAEPNWGALDEKVAAEGS